MRPIIHLISMAYQAVAALESAQDAPGLETAAKAISRYSQAILLTEPDDLEVVLDFRDLEGKGIPTLAQLHKTYLDLAHQVYLRIFPKTSAKVSGF